MSVINTNTSALAAQNSLRVTGLAQSTAMERLSSGIRINSAKDDAAGLAISTRMTANIRGISAAIRNANDGISLTQTAEGSLATIGQNLQRIRELAVQSANPGNNASDRTALNNEAAQLISEIDRTANNTNYNGIKLLDGSYKDQPLQVGAGNDSNDRISLSIGDARTARLGATLTASQQGIAISDGKKILKGAITINASEVGGTTSDGVSIALSEGSAISKANAINAIAAKTGVTAAATASTVTFEAEGAESAEANFKFLLNGVVISGSVEAEGADIGSASRIAGAINAQTANTGVFATYGSAGRYTLTASDGRNIVLSTDRALLMKAEGIDPDAIPADYGGNWGTTGIDAGQTRWTDLSTGDLIDPSSTDGGNSRVVYGGIDLSTDSLQGITLGGLDATTAKLGIEKDTYAANASAGSGVGSVNLNTSSGAQSALTTLDRAINAVTDMRAAMGAYQNRLAASISNLENTSMNLSASRSRILDTDYAKETTNLAKAQIIQQAATAMLAQANQSAQSVLALLK